MAARFGLPHGIVTPAELTALGRLVADAARQTSTAAKLAAWATLPIELHGEPVRRRTRYNV